MKAHFEWFKPQGKYYSEGEHELEATEFWLAVAEVDRMLSAGTRPGLVDGPRSEFHVYVEFMTQHGPLPHLFVAREG